MSKQTVGDFVKAMVQRGAKRDREIGVDRLPYELVFVNSDSGWRKVGKIEVSDRERLVWLYEDH
jgi:hypothetical protein